MTRTPDPRPYLSVVAWPPEHGRELVAQLLADAMGVDYESVRLRLGAAPPSIVGLFEAAAAERGVEALREAGGDGFTVTLGALEAMGATLRVRDLRLTGGIIEVEIWRGPTTDIQRADVQILVRAHLSEKTRDVLSGVPRRSGRPYAAPTRQPRPGVHGGIGGAMGLALGMSAAYAGDGVEYPTHHITTSDKLDIHTRNGLIFQIDGDKFGYHALGDLRGHGDKANMDRMCELLAHVSPDEIVDPYFELWSAPPGADRIRLPGMPLKHGEAKFAFYSRWVATLYRHVLGRA